MGTLLDTWQLVEAPPTVPYRYGVFSVVTPRVVPSPHWRLGVQWQTQNCTTVKQTAGPCIIEDVDPLDPDSV